MVSEHADNSPKSRSAPKRTGAFFTCMDKCLRLTLTEQANPVGEAQVPAEPIDSFTQKL